MTSRQSDGRAYGLPTPGYDAELTEVGPGTPMGELMRRYWHPVGLTADAAGTPRQIRALGEDLILFRDGKGRAGLVHPRFLATLKPRSVRVGSPFTARSIWCRATKAWS